MSTLLKPLLTREELLRRKIRIFTPLEFGRIFETPAFKIKYFLEKESHGGLFLRLKKGLYSLRTDLPGEEEIANRLYKPSYLSFEYALAYYNILPEMVYQITSATTKPTRVFNVGNKTFTYLTIKKSAYTGYLMKKQEAKSFLIAEPEKALVDYLYFVVLGKKSFNERLKMDWLDKKKLFFYAGLYQRKKLLKLIKQII